MNNRKGNVFSRIGCFVQKKSNTTLAESDGLAEEYKQGRRQAKAVDLHSTNTPGTHESTFPSNHRDLEGNECQQSQSHLSESACAGNSFAYGSSDPFVWPRGGPQHSTLESSHEPNDSTESGVHKQHQQTVPSSQTVLTDHSAVPLKPAIKKSSSIGTTMSAAQKPPLKGVLKKSSAPRLKSALKKTSSYSGQPAPKTSSNKSKPRSRSTIHLDFDASVIMPDEYGSDNRVPRRSSTGTKHQAATTETDVLLVPPIEFDSRSHVSTDDKSVVSVKLESRCTSDAKSVVSSAMHSMAGTSVASTLTTKSAPPNLWEIDKERKKDERSVVTDSELLKKHVREPDDRVVDVAQELHDTVLTSMLVQGNPGLAFDLCDEETQQQEDWMQFLDLSKGVAQDASVSMRRVSLRRQLVALQSVLDDQREASRSSRAAISNLIPPSPPLHKQRETSPIPTTARLPNVPLGLNEEEEEEEEEKLSQEKQAALKDDLREEKRRSKSKPR